MIEMLKVLYSSMEEKLGKYLKENLGTTLIIAFMILLILSAVFLLMGKESYANIVAVYSYYSLIIGVFLQLISFLRNKKKISNEK